MADSSNTRLDLDAIEKRANAATKGPWYCESDGIYDRNRSYLVLPVGNSDQDGTDAAFIAAARDDVPSLVAEARRLRAERPAVERLVAALRALKDAAKQIDFARPGQLTAEEGWALIHADDEAFEALAAFDARRADQ